MALIHYPVVNRNGDSIASAITNLDLHDIARAVVTFGVLTYYVVTPLKDQQALARRIIAHWTEGVGGELNPWRSEALRSIHVVDSLRDAVDSVVKEQSAAPVTVATSARPNNGCIGFGRLKKMMANGRPHLLMFGTAWGLDQEVLAKADHILEPIEGAGRYNHLSVRSAAAIILDRLLGKKQ